MRKTAVSRYSLPLLALVMAMVSPALSAPAAGDFSDLAGAPKTVEQSLADMNAKNDPCKYLDPGEVEATVGEKLVTPPFRHVGGRPDENGTACRYLFPRFRGLGVTVAKKGGEKIFEVLTGVTVTIDKAMRTPGNLNKTLPLEGEWDEVREGVDGGLHAIQGDILVSVAQAGLQLPREKVAALVNAIYRRLDKPLGIDGAAATGAARTVDKSRPQPRDPCGVVSSAAIAEIVGPVQGAPILRGASCTWTYLVNGVPKTFTYALQWRDSYSQYAMLRGTLISAVNVAQTSQPANVAAVARAVAAVDDLPPGAWDTGFASPMLFVAIRNDVLLQLSATDLPKAVIAKLAARIVAAF